MRRNLLAVPVGNSVRLDCSAEGNPRPTVKWYKDGNLFKERKSGYKLYWSRWATMLILKGLVPSDAGSYMCNVSNSYGWINHTYKLNVHGKTKILQMFPANLQTLVINVNSIKNSQIKINIASNETMDVFGLD